MIATHQTQVKSELPGATRLAKCARIVMLAALLAGCARQWDSPRNVGGAGALVVGVAAVALVAAAAVVAVPIYAVYKGVTDPEKNIVVEEVTGSDPAEDAAPNPESVTKASASGRPAACEPDPHPGVPEAGAPPPQAAPGASHICHPRA